MVKLNAYVSLFLVEFVLFTCVSGHFELTIVHNNDVHAHFDEIDEYYGECSDKEAKDNACFGGEARRNWFIKDVRKRISNTLVLDAGDRFSGTLWFTEYHGKAAATFINLENYDAVCIGNHEFDRGVVGLRPYLQNLTVPIVAANIDVSREPRLQGLFKPYEIIEVNSVRVGVVGYITAETGFISSPGPTVTFNDEIESVKRESQKLKDMGVEIIIGLSHAGYRMDQLVAAEVPYIDVIVGGHSHTFLYNGTKDDLPSSEKPDGPYPTLITQDNGRKVLIVQAFSWGKYMGLLNITFDEAFEVQEWSGRPMLLDHTVPKDPATQVVIETMKEPIEELKSMVVGRAAVRLEGDRKVCRLIECNLGNLLTDAMVEYHVNKRQSTDQWALSSIALLSGGSIRGSVQPGNISLGNVLTILPFGNVVDMVKLKGVHLRQVFEHSVAKYDPVDKPGAFLQVSGVHVVYDLSKKPGNRVVTLEARCLNCTMPEYFPLDDDAIYNILTVDFTIKGGDGYSMITDNVIEHVATNSLDTDIFKTYLEKHIPVYPDTEGRIKFVKRNEDGNVLNLGSNNNTCGEMNDTNSADSVRNNFIVVLFLALFFRIYIYQY